jgi:hypothetical protein
LTNLRTHTGSQPIAQCQTGAASTGVPNSYKPEPLVNWLAKLAGCSAKVSAKPSGSVLEAEINSDG